MIEFESAMNFRHACKLFDETKKINNEDFNFILESARLSPSSFGSEPWYFLVVTSDELKTKLRPICWNQAQITTCSHLVITLFRKACNFEENSEYLSKVMKRKVGDNKEAIKAAIDRFINHRENEALDSMDSWSNKQCYIAMGNMMTAAAIKKIDSCPIEGFDYNKFEACLLENISDNFDNSIFSVSHCIAFGYRGREQQKRTRWDLEQIVSFI